MQTTIIVALGMLAVVLTVWIVYDVRKRGDFSYRDGLAVLAILVSVIGIVVVWPNQPSTVGLMPPATAPSTQAVVANATVPPTQTSMPSHARPTATVQQIASQPTYTKVSPTMAPSSPTKATPTTCNASALFQQGWDLINKGTQNCSEAINSMSQAIACNSDNPEMWYGRGNVNFQCGEYANAVSDLTEAIKRNNRNPLYYEMRGLAYMRIGDRSSFEACVQDFNRVLELSPSNADAAKNRDLCQQRLK